MSDLDTVASFTTNMVGLGIMSELVDDMFTHKKKRKKGKIFDRDYRI